MKTAEKIAFILLALAALLLTISGVFFFNSDALAWLNQNSLSMLYTKSYWAVSGAVSIAAGIFAIVIIHVNANQSADVD